jgi:hypothetical protein
MKWTVHIDDETQDFSAVSEDGAVFAHGDQWSDGISDWLYHCFPESSVYFNRKARPCEIGGCSTWKEACAFLNGPSKGQKKAVADERANRCLNHLFWEDKAWKLTKLAVECDLREKDD